MKTSVLSFVDELGALMHKYGVRRIEKSSAGELQLDLIVDASGRSALTVTNVSFLFLPGTEVDGVVMLPECERTPLDASFSRGGLDVSRSPRRAS